MLMTVQLGDCGRSTQARFAPAKSREAKEAQSTQKQNQSSRQWR